VTRKQLSLPQRGFANPQGETAPVFYTPRLLMRIKGKSANPTDVGEKVDNSLLLAYLENVSRLKIPKQKL